MGRDPERQFADGPRPAVDWVLLLPRSWTSSAERLLLLVLALDTYSPEPPFMCSPSTAELASRCGWYKSDLAAAVASLEKTKGSRPPLIELDRGRGRKRSTYRLRTEHGAQLWPASGRESLDHNGSVDNSLAVGEIPTATEDVAVGEIPTATSGRDYPDHNADSGRVNGRVNGRGNPDHSLSLPQVHPPSVVREVQEGAPAGSVGVGHDLDTALHLLGKFAGHSAASCTQAVREQLARGWRPDQLAEHVSRGGTLAGARNPGAALRSRVERLGAPPVPVPPKCDDCDESRMVETDDGRPKRCPTCHPNRAAGGCPRCAHLQQTNPAWRCGEHVSQEAAS